MSRAASLARAAPAARAARGEPRRRALSHAAALGFAAAALTLLAAVSLSVGARSIPLAHVWDLLLHPDGSAEAAVIRDLRLPRTVLGILVGVALGVAGTLMQALTRNPLADPGLFGVNAGASVAMVVGLTTVGIDTTAGQLWCAIAGAAIATTVVYGIGSEQRGGSSPIRLALAGAAVSAVGLAIVQGAILLDEAALDRFRFWAAGALAGRDMGVVAVIAPAIAAGLAVTVVIARRLNALALGDDVAEALGISRKRTQVLGIVAITLLCGAATAAAGPIVFVGLAVAHAARVVAGSDERWRLGYAALLAPILLLAADVAGRVVDRPAEIGVGVVTAFLGAPVLIALVRSGRLGG